MPVISVDVRNGKPIICVGFGGSNYHEQHFPLTRKGARAAGEWLCDKGASDWLYSSSCHHPDDYKPKCSLDICKLVEEGYNLVWARAQSSK